MAVRELIAEGLLRECKVGRIDDKCDLSLPLVVVNPRKGDIEIATSQKVSLVLWHDDAKESALTLRLAPHAHTSSAPRLGKAGEIHPADRDAYRLPAGRLRACGKRNAYAIARDLRLE